MAKNARKKQRTTTEVPDHRQQPLGAQVALENDAEKDDEERRLESLLFGKAFAPRDHSSNAAEITFDDEDQAGGNALQQLQDDDLFFVDDAQPDNAAEMPDVQLGNDLDDDVAPVEKDTEVVDQDAEEDSTPEASTSKPPISFPLKSRKSAAWIDPDDSSIQVSLSENKRLRKLRDAPEENLVGGPQYEARLRREFERINPAPEWASNARKQLKSKKRRRSGEEMDVDSEEDGEINLLTSTAGVISSSKSLRLPKGTIAIERLRDANHSAPTEGAVKAVQFHPSPRIPVLLTVGSDRRLRLFNVDGHTNPHVQTVHVPALPCTNATFHPHGTSILMTGPRPFFYHVDLQTGITTRSPRGLWGTTFTSSTSNPSSKNQAEGESLQKCAFDPSGDMLAVAGRRGYVHLVDWRSGGAQVVGSVKMNSPVQSLHWSPLSGDLLTLGEDSEVYIWDVKQRRCLKRWKDAGGYGSALLAGDSGGKYLSVGSKMGLVNLYGHDAMSSYSDTPPKELKTLGNLTTSISTLRFNHDSQLLAMASDDKKDQMRLVHLPSLTVYSNWPTSSTPLGHVTCVDFSKGSEYIAAGNNRGRVLLYQLSHFIGSGTV